MKIVRNEIDPLEVELLNLRTYKNDLAEIQSKLDNQTELVAMMLKDRGHKSKTLGGYRYTLVQAERTKINEAGLKKAIGARAFNKLVTPKIDTGKVQAAISDGTLDPVVLEQHAEVVLNKPSIRVSEVQEDA